MEKVVKFVKTAKTQQLKDVWCSFVDRTCIIWLQEIFYYKLNFKLQLNSL